MTGRVYNVLFLCTGNSARSILAEAILNRLGQGRFVAFSAGSHPNGRVNPHALDLLNRQGFDTSGLRSKSWDEFAASGAPELDFVFAVCDNAAGEVCPVEKATAFRETFRALERRIGLLVALPIGSLDRLSLTASVREIGRA